MIDFRHQTFLVLAEIKNYTKAAKHLHITQPAVTQHIQFLEEKYRCKLFFYQNKKLELTIQGKNLQELLMRIFADVKHFTRSLEKQDDLEESIIFGATLTIGEYIMPKIISQLLHNNPHLNIHMEVHNTEVLLKRLWNGEIDFAILEGIFDKSKYESILFSQERFIPICSPKSSFAKKEIQFNELLSSPLVVREKGSGTREILENILTQKNYTLNSFKQIIEIGNMSAIKKLVKNNYGISFLYEQAVIKELEQGILTKINIPNLNIVRELNFVFLKNSFYQDKFIKYFNAIKNLYEKKTFDYH